MGDPRSDPTSPALATKSRYMGLEQGGLIQVEYVWIGGKMTDLRCKTRTIPTSVTSASELPEWNYDGSSTGQAPGEDSEVILRPQAIFADPFRGGDNIVVLCDTYTPQGDPLPTNKRAPAMSIFSHPEVAAEEPWYGLEQEYTLFNADGRTVLGWPTHGYPAPQGMYYCGVGTHSIFGRNVVEAHYRACMHAGVKIAGCNAEVMPGQWEYQIGPARGIQCGDHVWMSRYILDRVCEEFGVIASVDPKPIPGDWNGAGLHMNFSTKSMRADGGYKTAVPPMLKALGDTHVEHMRIYGEGNERRMTGRHETASYDSFSYGVANRGASIRIPRQMERDGKGYIEDRRPASNADPYVISSKMAETCVLRAKGVEGHSK
eukprot:TRINITY_DN44035_c0_g1_i1.p1 TRINITY_DN44035_c0_g1~~TRINITY_DN44035_c0_g1_i1.p1  ORF type:complete len:374 (-),score=60.39 TRINITY_DN44035_c0_g1_i1:810-1931(-)